MAFFPKEPTNPGVARAHAQVDRPTFKRLGYARQPGDCQYRLYWGMHGVIFEGDLVPQHDGALVFFAEGHSWWIEHLPENWDGHEVFVDATVRE